MFALKSLVSALNRTLSTGGSGGGSGGSGGSGGGTTPSSSDPYWNNVVLLMHFNGVNGSTTFTDEKGHIATAVGNAKLTTANKAFGTASLQMTDANSYVTVANSPDWDFNTSMVTIECSVYIPTFTGIAQYIIGQSMASDHTWVVYVYPDGSIAIGQAGNGETVSTPGKVTFNQFNNIAIVKTATGGNDIYVNGVLALTTPTSWFNASANPLVIGSNIPSVEVPGVLFDELRITKGVARYTANFTVPTSEFPGITISYDPYWENVSSLLHFDGANSSTSLIDEKGNVVTAVGTAALSNIQSKFGPTSGHFADNVSYLQVASTTGFLFGHADFTVEFMLNPAATAAPGGDGYRTILTTAMPTNGTGIWMGVSPTMQLAIEIDNNGAWANIGGIPASGTITLAADTWAHIALVRFGLKLYTFINGVLDQNITITDLNITNSNNLLAIGARSNATEGLNGYIDELRITKGVARYTGNFTAPSTQFADSRATDYAWDSTVFLMHMNGVDNGTTFTDEKGSVITKVGNAKLTASDKVFGTTSLMITDSSSYLSIPFNTNWQLASGAATVEMWFKLPTTMTNAFQMLIGQTALSADHNWMIYAYKTGSIAVGVNGNNELASPVGKFALGAWVHLAVIRLATGTINMYINGVLAMTGTTAAFNNGTNPLYIGGSYAAANTAGVLIDDVRVTKGVARYTANFSVPNAEYSDANGNLANDPYWAQTTLLMHNDTAAFADVKGHTVSNAAPGALDSTVFKTGTNSFRTNNGGYLSVANSADFNISTNDLTVECWVNPTGYTSVVANIISQYSYFTGGGWAILMKSNGQITNTINGYAFAGVGSALPISAWTHVAFVFDRAASLLTWYIGGINVGSVAWNPTADATVPLHIGSFVNGQDWNQALSFNGNVDEVRITKAKRYLGNFTPPAYVLPNQ